MYAQIINFWFEEIDSAMWWKKDDGFDALLVERFTELHTRARRCELFDWRKDPQGRLAEIIVLDQFSRNMFRDSALAANESLNSVEKSFLYMPFMHSESLAIHEVAVQLFSEEGLESNLDFELKHKRIIEKFGRYPHRNKLLGRQSTAEEIEFLTKPGSSF